MNDKETKDALKEALKEWLDERYAEFGKFAFHSLSALALTALIYFILRINGWSVVKPALN